MKPEKFTDAMLLVIGEDRSYRHHHMSDPTKKRFKDAEGRIYNVDLTKSYCLHGWSPWRKKSWRNPFSLSNEWSWRMTHKVALLIYPDTPSVEGQVIEPMMTFDPQPKAYTDVTPRGYEGLVETKIPIRYFKKWTTGNGKIPLYIWILLGILVIAVIAIMARGGF